MHTLVSNAAGVLTLLHSEPAAAVGVTRNGLRQLAERCTRPSIMRFQAGTVDAQRAVMHSKQYTDSVVKRGGVHPQSSSQPIDFQSKKIAYFLGWPGRGARWRGVAATGAQFFTRLSTGPVSY